MRKISVQLYDSFARIPFGGNVAGVVTDAVGLTGEEMLALAAEINAPTTGFAVARDDGDLDLRFFTPRMEIAMCGHVTVAMSVALARQLGSAPFPAMFTFRTGAGKIPVEVTEANGGPPQVTMTQRLPEFRAVELAPRELARLLDLRPEDFAADQPPAIVSTGLRHLLVAVRERDALRRQQPDFEAVARVCRDLEVDTLAVFALDANSRDLVRCRDLTPAVGVPEEPASGTTAGALSSYVIRDRLTSGTASDGQHTIWIEQGFELGRPSHIRCEIAVRQGRIAAVRVSGTARPSMVGEMYLD